MLLRYSILALSMIAAGIPHQLYAQNFDSGAGEAAPIKDEIRLQEVIVHVQKREQRAFSVPISFSVFDDERINEMGIENVNKLSQWTPGVTFFKQSVIHPNLSIRGITANNTSPYEQPRVSVYQNGVDISRTNGASIAYYDLQHIDVLKGPQGSLFGRAAAIGALNITQNIAGDYNAGSVELTAGNDNKRGVEAMANAVLMDNTLFARLAIFSDQEEGNVENQAGGHLNGEDTQAGRFSMLYRINDEAHLSILANIQKDRPSHSGFISLYDDFRNTENFYHANAEAGKDLTSDRDLWDVTMKFTGLMDDFWTFHSISSVRDFETAVHFDADGMQAMLLDSIGGYEHKQASQEVRFNFEGDDLAGFIGSNILYEDGQQQWQLSFDEAKFLQLPVVQGQYHHLTGGQVPFYAKFHEDDLRTAPDINQPWTAYPTLDVVREQQIYSVQNRYIDFFGDMTFPLAYTLELTIGLRASYESLLSKIETPAAENVSGTAQFLSTLPGVNTSNMTFSPSASAFEQSDDFWNFSGRIVLAWQLQENLNTYASYSRGVRSNVLTFSVLSEEKMLAPETVDSYEVGIKWHSNDHQHRLNATAFYYDYRHFNTASSNFGASLLDTFEDNGEAENQGVEVEGASLLSQHWRLFGNVAYLDARISDDEKFAHAGNYFRMSPKLSGAFGIDYQQSVLSSMHVLLGLNISYQSKVYFEEYNDSFFGENTQEAYSLLNLHSLLASNKNSWQIRFFIDNILDEEYFLDAGNIGEDFGLSTYIPGRERSYRLSYKINF